VDSGRQESSSSGLRKGVIWYRLRVSTTVESTHVWSIGMSFLTRIPYLAWRRYFLARNLGLKSWGLSVHFSLYFCHCTKWRLLTCIGSSPASIQFLACWVLFGRCSSDYCLKQGTMASSACFMGTVASLAPQSFCASTSFQKSFNGQKLVNKSSIPVSRRQQPAMTRSAGTNSSFSL
jgi:hypothetical protein